MIFHYNKSIIQDQYVKVIVINVIIEIGKIVNVMILGKKFLCDDFSS